MLLSADQHDRLQLSAAIIWDRGMGIEIDFRNPENDVDLDDIADRCLEIIAAAEALETLCARLTRGARWHRAQVE